MAEDIRMDSHKLMFHPQRVSDWLDGKDIYPLTVEISPSGACNHRCIFCGLDYLDYKPRFLNKNLIIPNLADMYQKGVKAVVLAGEGEPLLNRDTTEIIRCSRDIGLDIGMSTNGVLFTRQLAQNCLASLTWVRFSVNAASDEEHQIVHRSRPGDFNKVLHNLADAVEVKKTGNLSTTIGVQLVLIPENSRNILAFADKLKSMGVDYFAVKPFSQHPQSRCNIDPDFDYQDYLLMEDSLKAINNDSFQVIFRAESMKKLGGRKNYQSCLGIPFWAYIDANAAVWPCLAYIGQEEFCLGNLQDKSFSSIWKSETCRKILHMISHMDISKCRELCRLDAINEYLCHLVNPGAHVNFV